MNLKSWKRIEEVFEAALQREGTDRTAFLDEACCDDNSLRGEIESLLAIYPEADRLLGTLDADSASQSRKRSASQDAPRTVLGQRIGAYRIKRVIASGGMGIVYEAEQDKPRRTVAIKVINSRIASPEALRRFEHEAQVLARLQHPGIAQVFEAGHTDAETGGQPYFAMEYIEGLALTEHADAHRLSTRQRLELFLKVCDAVQYAHQRGVIHRDLKPANILVQEESHMGDEDGPTSGTTPPSTFAGLGQPKILDFGVARLTDADVETATQHAKIGQLVGTLQYMSPEQCQGDPYALDTRSDVYSLGVLCFELLAGCPPHDLSELSIPDAVRIITEQDPPRLGSIDRAFRGDLDTIVRKALEKDKAQRYQSASDLAEDVRRFLSDQPILARPASIRYQMSKFTKRNKMFVAAAVTALVCLIGATAVVTGLLVRINLQSQHIADSTVAANRAGNIVGIAVWPEYGWERSIADRGMPDRSMADRLKTKFEGWEQQARQPFGKEVWPPFEHRYKEVLGQAFSEFGIVRRCGTFLASIAGCQPRILWDCGRAHAALRRHSVRPLARSGQVGRGGHALAAHI